MARIAKSIQQGNGNAFRHTSSNLQEKLLKVLRGRSTQDRTVVVKTLGQLQAVLTRNQCRRALLREIVERRAVLASNFQDIGETLGRDEYASRAFPLQEGVCCHC